MFIILFIWVGGGPGVGFVGVRWGGGGWGGVLIYIYSIYIWSGPGPEFGSQIRGPVFWTVSKVLAVDKTIDREVLLTTKVC